MKIKPKFNKGDYVYIVEQNYPYLMRIHTVRIMIDDTIKIDYELLSLTNTVQFKRYKEEEIFSSCDDYINLISYRWELLDEGIKNK